MLKTKTIKYTFTSVSGLSIGVNIQLLLTDASLAVYASANDNPIVAEESPEDIFSAGVLVNEFSEIQNTLIESVWAKLKKIDAVESREMQRFVNGDCIGLRYVFTDGEFV